MQATTDSAVETRVIDLAELRTDDDFPAYAALYNRDHDYPQLLSPHSMRWSDEIMLARLDDCKNFWLRQKKKLRCKLGELFEPLLGHHYGENYIAVFGDHPWQCLLYLSYQARHAGRGIYFLNSPINRNIYKTLDWDIWFDAQTQLFEHLTAINAAGFREQAIRSRQARLRRLIERIGVTGPQQMIAADANAMRRRFDKWLALIWHWSFFETTSLDGFPWIPLRQANIPVCRRDLEYPVNQWQYIEQLLREDLARLCAIYRQDDCEHVNRICWQITLFNDDRLEVELSFRNPYSLHRDQPDFATALYQARYVYEAVMRELKTRDRDLDLPEQMPFVSWSVEVTERILLAPALWDLFADQSDQADYQRLFALQNKLPLAFESYALNASFFPESSFRSIAPGADESMPMDTSQWSHSACNKPLFYYREPLPIEAPKCVQQIFLERNSNQWWLGGDALQSIRDYFMLNDPVQGASWVYRTADGAWFKQGEFF